MLNGRTSVYLYINFPSMAYWKEDSISMLVTREIGQEKLTHSTDDKYSYSFKNET